MHLAKRLLNSLVGYDQKHMVTPGSQVSCHYSSLTKTFFLVKTENLAINCWFWSLVLSLHPFSYCSSNSGSPLVKLKCAFYHFWTFVYFNAVLNAIKGLTAQMVSNHNNNNKNCAYLARFFRPWRLADVTLVILFASRWSSERELGRPGKAKDD